MKKKLQLPVLFDILRSSISSFPDCRTGENTQYSMETFGMTAFSAFFMQSPSFHSHEALMNTLHDNENALNLFNLETIPCPNQTRTILDTVSPEYLLPVYNEVFHRLERSGLLAELRGFKQDILIPLDGSWYFSSKKICCQNCSHMTHKDGSITYYHSAIIPAIVVPWNKMAIPLAPEFIMPQDGQNKQDCEVNAAKRWLTDFRRTHKRVSATILGDDLYAKQPMCETVLENRLNFIFVCKRESHPTLYARLDELEERGDLHTLVIQRKKKGDTQIETYRYALEIPLRATDDALLVNWVELIQTDDKTNTVVYHNAFITKHLVNDQTVEAVVAAGRSRWKIENEDYNTLKNHGYNLEHNYGHGEKYLSSLLASFIILAFLFHTILDLVHGTYALLRDMLPSRKEFFGDVRTLLRYIRFGSVQDLFDFMFSRLVGQFERNYAPG